MKKAHTIFEHTDCISEVMVTKYVSGKLSAAEKYGVERHLADCEMCSDAMDGLEIISDKNKISAITEELNKKIQIRINAKDVNKVVKIVFIQKYRSQLAIAASVIIILGLVFVFRYNLSMNNEPGTAASQKIFADKFAPYPTEQEAIIEQAPPVPPQGSAAQREILLERNSTNEEDNEAPADDKQPSSKEVEASKQRSTGATKLGSDYYSVPVEEKREVQALKSVDADASGAEAGAARRAEKISNSESFEFGGVTNSPDVSKTQTKMATDKIVRQDEEGGQRTAPMAIRLQEGESRSKVKKSSNNQSASPSATSSFESVQPVASEIAGLALRSDDAYVAMQKYEQKNYQGAAEEFEKILAKEPNNYNALFYSAVSYLSLGQTDKALTNLNKILEKKDGEFYDAAQWYASLAYIKNNDRPNARKNLMELKNNSDSKYQKQASETLNQMQK